MEKRALWWLIYLIALLASIYIVIKVAVRVTDAGRPLSALLLLDRSFGDEVWAQVPGAPPWAALLVGSGIYAYRGRRASAVQN